MSKKKRVGESSESESSDTESTQASVIRTPTPIPISTSTSMPTTSTTNNGKQRRSSSASSSSSSSSSNSDSKKKTKKNKKTSVATNKKKGVGAKPKSKNPPGRPRKNPPIPEKPVNGIVNKPEDPEDLFELIYYVPSSMKKISSFIKSIRSSHVQILMLADKLVLFAQDNYKTNTATVIFDGSKMHHFYCKRPMNVGVSTKNLIKVFDVINKRHSCFAITQRASDEGQWIDICFINGYTGIKTEKSISLTKEYTQLTPELSLQFGNIANAAIHFQYPSYDFKRLISGSKGPEKNKDRVRFIQHGKGPLIIEIDQTDGQIKSRDVFDSKDIKVQFESKVADDDIFSIMASTDALKAVSSASLGKIVEVFLTEKMPILTRISVDDNAILVCTLTKLSEKKIKPVTKPKKKSRNDSSSEEDNDNDDSDSSTATITTTITAAKKHINGDDSGDDDDGSGDNDSLTKLEKRMK